MPAEPSPSPELLASVFSRQCDSRELFEVVTGKWPSLVLLAMAQGLRRFGELRRQVDGVSEKMLSQALDDLETHGFLTRTDLGTQPPHVDYQLTEVGADVAQRLRYLSDFLEARVNSRKDLPTA